MHTPQSQSVSPAHDLTAQSPVAASQRVFTPQAASEVQWQPFTSPGAPQARLAPQVKAPVSHVSGAQPWASTPFLAMGSQCVCAREQAHPSVAHEETAQPLTSTPVRVGAHVRPAGQANPSAHGNTSQCPSAPQRSPAAHDVAVHRGTQTMSGPVAQGAFVFAGWQKPPLAQSTSPLHRRMGCDWKPHPGGLGVAVQMLPKHSALDRQGVPMGAT